ncbi:MAG: hypothetical protein E6G88_06390 [Alphaproteobacteria bacterium]|nr:MAG: hypothetical protein E6G88_06390 [Alphaproteobacteria bacterium]HYS51524.1 hypothetical protein [Burkholderiales bacterium]
MEIAQNHAAGAAAKLAKLCPPNNAPPVPQARRIAAAPAPPHGSAHRLRSGFQLPGAIGHCSAKPMDMAGASSIIHANEHRSQERKGKNPTFP